jgi:hypothetical protein
MFEAAGVLLDACEQLAAWSCPAGYAVVGRELTRARLQLLQRQRGTRSLEVVVDVRNSCRIWWRNVRRCGHYGLSMTALQGKCHFSNVHCAAN